MDSKSRLLEKLNLPRDLGEGRERKSDQSISEMMMNSGYLTQSSQLINEALQKGFDVLQMEDGEIVMTGTKTVIYRYHWDASQGALIRHEVQDPEEQERLQLSDVSSQD